MLDSIVLYLQSVVPFADDILMALGSLVVLAQAYVIATPNPNDDAVFNKIYSVPLLGDILKLLTKFAVVQKKSK